MEDYVAHAVITGIRANRLQRVVVVHAVRCLGNILLQCYAATASL